MLKPNGKTIWVKLPPTQEVTSTGLIIPESAQEVSHEGLVVGIGPEAVEYCELFEIDIGSRVFFYPYSGLDYEDKLWGKCVILKPTDIEFVMEAVNA